jgi:DNA-binding transcriptional LysR family regulator
MDRSWRFVESAVAENAMNEPRLQSLLPLWSWLPAFRVVAETEHLPTAARLAATSPSALSRSLALLERQLGQPLFRRQGRTLRLNTAGEELLVAVRDAMRRVDDGVSGLHGPGLHGPLTIGSLGAGTTAFVAPAVQRLLAQHPGLLPTISTPSGDLVVELRTGRCDIVFQEAPLHAKDLRTLTVGAIARSIYCGRQHPWFGRDEVSEGELMRAAFVAPPRLADGSCPDGWPADRPRCVAVTVDQLRVGVDLCRDGPWLAVLPDLLAKRYGGELQRLPFAFVLPSQVHAICRRPVSKKPNAVDALLAALG